MEAIVFAVDPITWKSQDPVWVEQWPIPKERLLLLLLLSRYSHVRLCVPPETVAH